MSTPYRQIAEYRTTEVETFSAGRRLRRLQAAGHLLVVIATALPIATTVFIQTNHTLAAVVSIGFALYGLIWGLVLRRTGSAIRCRDCNTDGWGRNGEWSGATVLVRSYDEDDKSWPEERWRCWECTQKYVDDASKKGETRR